MADPIDVNQLSLTRLSLSGVLVWAIKYGKIKTLSQNTKISLIPLINALFYNTIEIEILYPDTVRGKGVCSGI